MGKSKLYTKNKNRSTKSSNNRFEYSDEFSKFIKSKEYTKFFNNIKTYDGIRINQSDIEDVSQELLLSLCKSKKYDHSRNCLESFFKVAVRNKKIDYLRRKFKKNSIKFTSELNSNSVDLRKNTNEDKNILDSIIDEEDRDEKKQLLYKCLQCISQKEIDILIGIYIYNNNYELFAKSLNMPVGTVKTHVFRTKQKLKELIEKCRI